ncbi:hypothetical protein TSAR_003993 [Trichomalopsis sarcophagae]|uniref:SMB domain-containing protein n=1 Tax=Trichomalopsis sarcophagae TaxID=543379 RepID=A0A232EI90_9HYME|nr:hypothetical protein TSAR_003993 [Trichomalopsis sarcophagae]
MSKVLVLLLAIILTSTLAVARNSCSPWLGYCQVYEDCCRDLECSSYAGKCVPVNGLKIPGKDQRPTGPGPFPPSVMYRPF